MGRRDRIAGERLAGHLQIVNLCFHGIGIPERELEPGEDRYWVTVERFEELMALVAGERSIRLTFDDGNASDLAVALPVLSRYGLRAQFFVVAGRLGQRGSLPAEGLRTLVEAGMSIGSHGMQHRSWRSLGAAEREEELVRAAQVIGEASGRPVNHAACPFGEYDRTLLRALRRHGYARVYTVDDGPARSDQWLQSRYCVRSTTTPEVLERLARDPLGGMGRAILWRLKGAVKRLR